MNIRTGRILSVLVLLIAVTSVSACSHRKVAAEPSPTVGQQLIDLKTAKEQGAITEDEYNTLREKALKSSKSCPYAKGKKKCAKSGCCAKGTCAKDGKCPHAKKWGKKCGVKGDCAAGCPSKACAKRGCKNKQCPHKDCPAKGSSGSESGQSESSQCGAAEK